MHALFMTRGGKKHVDELVKWLETRDFKLPFTNKDGSKGVETISALLQPIQLWSYVFPEGHKDEVLTALKFDDKRWINNKKTVALTTALRLAMGGSKIPKFEKKGGILMPLVELGHTAIIPIGVRYDDIMEFPNGKTHEAL